MPSTPDPADRMGGPLLPVEHGRWRLELRGDEVADVSFAGVPLLRAIRPVVRDRDWNTVPVRVLDRSEQRPADGQRVITTELLFEAAPVRYRAVVTVTLAAAELVVDLAGEALTDFERNRIGLVVLHRADDAGQPVGVLTTSGTVVPGRWPVPISPHQPFADLVGFRWPTSRVDVELDLDGDVFETEDQRNWTDLSFKTYSTPLALPFPVAVRTGDRVHQRARLRVSDLHPDAARPVPRPSRWRPATGPEEIEVTRTSRATVPALALGASDHLPATMPTPAAPGYEAVLVELVGDPAGWPDRLRTARRQAEALGAGLDVRLVTADPAVVTRTVEELPPPVIRLGVFSPATHVSTPTLWDTLVAAAGRAGFAGDLVGGTRAHFTELNRTFDDLPPSLPALTFSLTGQMHASEVPHLVDSLAGQRLVAENAVRLAAGRRLHVGPVTLARRFNAVATSGTTEVDPDPLQTTGFAAAWTLGSIDALTLDGVASVCYFETSGPGGVVDGSGRPYPVQQVLAVVAGLRGRRVLESSSPAHLVGYAVADDAGGTDLLVANVSPHQRTASVRLPGAEPFRLGLPGWSVVHRRVG